MKIKWANVLQVRIEQWWISYKILLISVSEIYHVIQEPRFTFQWRKFVPKLLCILYSLGVSPSLVSRYCEVSGVFEDLKFEISEGSDKNCLSLAETANRADSGQL